MYQLSRFSWYRTKKKFWFIHFIPLDVQHYIFIIIVSYHKLNWIHNQLKFEVTATVISFVTYYAPISAIYNCLRVQTFAYTYKKLFHLSIVNIIGLLLCFRRTAYSRLQRVTRCAYIAAPIRIEPIIESFVGESKKIYRACYIILVGKFILYRVPSNRLWSRNERDESKKVFRSITLSRLCTCCTTKGPS